jgi:ketosteroid isomerase-like protein
MNPGFAVVLLIVTLSQGASLVAERTEFTPDQQEVIKVSQAWNDAYNRRDLEAYAGHMSEEFIGTTEESSITKAGLVKFVRERPQRYQQRQDPREYGVRIDGDTAVLTYLVT